MAYSPYLQPLPWRNTKIQTVMRVKQLSFSLELLHCLESKILFSSAIILSLASQLISLETGHVSMKLPGACTLCSALRIHSPSSSLIIPFMAKARTRRLLGLLRITNTGSRPRLLGFIIPPIYRHHLATQHHYEDSGIKWRDYSAYLYVDH
jgi:hypothetical protein